jgi:FAD dependent oxidoreductase TIGR03364
VTVERVVIVGGGVVGTMHAVDACRRGWEVIHLEADAAPRRASVRNFGLLWISGRAVGAELALALRARQRWAELAGRSLGIGFRPLGSVTVARHEAELELMAEAVARPDGAEREFELLDADGVRKVNPALRGDLLGGLWCRSDAVVEPGSVLGSLREGLADTGRYQWLPGRRAVDVLSAPSDAAGGPGVVDHLGHRHRGSLVMLCIGDRLTGLGGRIGEALGASALRRCQLQMMQTAPVGEQVGTAVADADSLRYYPAFDLPGREALPPAGAEAGQWAMQLLLVQRAGGGITIGDTHVYEEPFDFAVEESVYEALRERAEAILGWPLPPAARRWSGSYSLVPDGRPCFREELDTGVWVVTGTAGRGMTLAPAIAEQTWDQVSR